MSNTLKIFEYESEKKTRIYGTIWTCNMYSCQLRVSQLELKELKVLIVFAWMQISHMGHRQWHNSHVSNNLTIFELFVY